MSSEKQGTGSHGGAGEAVGAVVFGVGFPVGDPGVLRGNAHDQPALRGSTRLGGRGGRAGAGIAPADPAGAGHSGRLAGGQVRRTAAHRGRHAAAGCGVCQPGLCPERAGADPLLRHLGAGRLSVRSAPRRPGDQIHPAPPAGALHLLVDDAGERRRRGGGPARQLAAQLRLRICLPAGGWPVCLRRAVQPADPACLQALGAADPDPRRSRPGAGGQGVLPAGADPERLLRALGPGDADLPHPGQADGGHHHGGGLDVYPGDRHLAGAALSAGALW